MTNTINQFIDIQFLAMHDLFAEGGIAVYRGTTEDLSGNAALQPLQNFNVGSCTLGAPTADHTALFSNRNNAGANDLVIYVVSTLIGGAGNFLGCATHPAGQPGAVVIWDTAQWLTAHEVGHVLGLEHVAQSDSLMLDNVGWTNVPPDVASSEYTKMFSSSYTNAC